MKDHHSGKMEAKPNNRRLIGALFNALPERNEWLYHVSRRYVDRYNGDNNSDFYTNGEHVFMLDQIKKSRVAFDIGANIGEWARAALAVNPDLQLHCFEPSSDTFDRLQNNGFPPNVSLNQFGLGSAPGELDLHVVETASGMNSVYNRRGVFLTQEDNIERIKIDTLDGYCQSRGITQIDFIKVDVEGHELEVFKGMRGLLAAGAVRVIQFEYGGCNLDAKVFLADIWDFFGEFGMTFYKLHSRGPKLVKTYVQSLDNLQYQNWAIIRGDG